MRNSRIVVVILLLIHFNSLYSQNQGRVIFPKDLEAYAEQAIEPNYSSFIVYENGDTLKGEILSVKYNMIKLTSKLILDDKVIEPTKHRITHIQNKTGFYSIPSFFDEDKGVWIADVINASVRVVRGKIEMFCGTSTTLAPNSFRKREKMQYATSSTRVYEGRKAPNSSLDQLTMEAVKEMVKDNAAATAKFNEFFPNRLGIIERHYKKVAEIFTIYNQ